MDQYRKNEQGLNIHTIEHLFEGDEVFLLCHGFTGSVQSHVIRQIRSYLKEAKLSSVSIDFTNNINDSEGDFSLHTVSSEVDDLKVIYDSVLKRYSKVYLIGHSMGCTVSLQFALHYKVDGLILIAPPYSMKDIIDTIAKTTHGDGEEALRKWAEEGTTSFYKESLNRYYSLNYSFYQDLLKIDPKRYRDLHVPSVIIYSLADALVPPEDSEKLCKEIGAGAKRLIPIFDADHSFLDPKSTAELLHQCKESILFLKGE